MAAALTADGSDKIDRVSFEVDETHELQRLTMGGLETHFGRATGFERLLPARGAQAPSVTRLEAREAEFRPWGRQVVTPRQREFEEVRGHERTDGVGADVRGIGLAAATTKPAGYRGLTADGEGITEHIDLTVVTVAAAVHRGVKGTRNPSF